MAEGTARAVTIAILLFWVLPNVVYSQGLSKEIEDKLRELAKTRRELPIGRIDSILEQAKSRPDVKELIENEFKVRQKFTLKVQQECTLSIHRSLNIEKPPATIKEYLAWQKAIIASTEGLCNIRHGLQCAPREECVCGNDYTNGKVALVVSPPGAPEMLQDSEEECLRLSGRSCGQYDPSPKYFDPLRLLMDGTEGEVIVPLPANRTNFPYCERSPRASQGRPLPCTKYDFFPDSRCLGFDEDKKNGELAEMVTNLLTLGAGSACNEEKSKELFNPDPAEATPATKTRLHKILDEEKMNSTGFCDLRQLVTCGAGGACECLAPFKLNAGTKKCEIPLWHRCGRSGDHEEQVRFIDDAKLNSLVHRGIKEGLARAKCDSRSDCVMGPIEEGEMYQICACKIGKIGESCDIEPTGLLKKIKPSAYPSDVPDALKQVKIFAEFNAKIIPFEKHMTQAVGQVCNDAVEKEAMEVRNFIQGLTDEDAMDMKSLRTKQKYLEIGAKAEKAVKGEKLCANNVMCSIKKCRTISQPDELAEYESKVKELEILTEGQPCTLNSSSTETDVDGRITHLKNLVNMKKPLCRTNGDLLCLPKDGQLGFCQCPNIAAKRSGCKELEGPGQLSLNSSSSTVGIHEYQARIPVPIILMIIFAIIFSM